MIPPSDYKEQLGIDWPLRLSFRQGKSRLAGVEIYFDFDWQAEFGHNKPTFPHGQKLCELILAECPNDKAPALLLTASEGVVLSKVTTATRHIVIVQIIEYRKRATSNAAMAFCASTSSSPLTSIAELVIRNEGQDDAAGQAVNTATTSGEVTDNSIISFSNGREQPGSESGNRSDDRLRLALDGLHQIDDNVLGSVSRLIEKWATTTVERSKTATAHIARILRACVGAPKLSEVIALIDEHGLIASDLERAVTARVRALALAEFKQALDEDEDEHYWQAWFKKNSWVLGSECVRILEAREIDTSNTADYIVEAFDGHVDIVEIKRPRAEFWSSNKDHGNWIPHSDLVKALVQAEAYLFELEREMNSIKTNKRLNDTPIAKPRGLLIHGRSTAWDADKKHAQRLLNGSLVSVKVATYDQVLARAHRVFDLSSADRATSNTHTSDDDVDVLP